MIKYSIKKNRGTEENPDYDYISDDGVSYFDPFDLKSWGENGEDDLWYTSDDMDVEDFFGNSQDKEDYNAYMEEQQAKEDDFFLN